MAQTTESSWRQRLIRYRGGRVARRLRRNDDGSAAVEFGMVALPFFATLFAILETGLVFFAGQVLDTATEQASRMILTGQAQNQGFSAAQFKTELCANIFGLLDCENGVKIDVTTYPNWAAVDVSPPIDADGNVTATGQVYQPGTQGSIVVVRAIYEFPIVVQSLGYNLADLANGKRLLVSTVAFKNEPYK